MTITAAPDIPALDHVERIYQAQQKNRAAVGATTAAQRIQKLRRLEQTVLARRAEIQKAMWDDYRKPPTEVDLSEIYPVVGEARHAIRHVRSWMRPKRVSTQLALLGARSSIVYEPRGAVLIIAPWNFPFNLTLGPLVSAIAAGNCAMLKPSEMTPASTACIKRLVGDLFPEEEVAIVEGDSAVAQELLRKRFDHIFFTGSPRVGRIVMKAAAEHLTSVTLELGGKSPVIVDRTADVAEAARKVAWGKYINSGQMCIAPDYVLVHEEVRDAFLEQLRERLAAFGTESRGWLVHDGHASRVRSMLSAATAAGATVFSGGKVDGRSHEPTVLTNVPPGTAVMDEEIFGPLLPVLTYRSLDEAFAEIDRHEKPLVLYAFTRDRQVARNIVARTRAGGTVINHTMLHFYELELPFGGVGHSGFGKAHGFHGFEAFSNARGVLEQRLKWAGIDLLAPPYGSKLQKWLVDVTLRWL